MATPAADPQQQLANGAAAPAAPGGEAAPAAAAAPVPPDQPWGETSLQQLRAALQQFAAERDWGQYHTPRNLVLALVGGASEGWHSGMRALQAVGVPRRAHLVIGCLPLLPA